MVFILERNFGYKKRYWAYVLLKDWFKHKYVAKFCKFMTWISISIFDCFNQRIIKAFIFFYLTKIIKDLLLVESIDVQELKDYAGSLSRKLDSIDNYLLSTVSNKKDHLDGVYTDLKEFMSDLAQKRQRIRNLKQ